MNAFSAGVKNARSITKYLSPYIFACDLPTAPGLGDDDSHDDIILGSVLVSIFQVFSTGFRCSVCKTEVSCDVDAVDRHLKTNHGNIVIKNVSRLHTKMISARDRLMKLRLADETQRRSNHEVTQTRRNQMMMQGWATTNPVVILFADRFRFQCSKFLLSVSVALFVKSKLVVVLML